MTLIFLIFVDYLQLSFEKLSSVKGLSFWSSLLLLYELRPFKMLYLTEYLTLRLTLT
jgi:hypothetical protein